MAGWNPEEMVMKEKSDGLRRVRAKDNRVWRTVRGNAEKKD